jgi:hypothetical protein
MRDWTWTSDTDCKTPEELEERHEWLERRYLASKEAGERAEKEREREEKVRQQRIRQGQLAGKQVDGDGLEYAPQLKDDHRALLVRDLEAKQVVTLARWEWLCGSTWDATVRINFAHQCKHGRLATTEELQKELTALKKRRPELNELPSEDGRIIVWEVSGAFSKFLAAPWVEVDSEPFRSLEPDFSLLQRRSTNNFYFRHVVVVGETRDGGVIFKLPKLGGIRCYLPPRRRHDWLDEWHYGPTFIEELTDPLQRSLRPKSGRLYRHPGTGEWKFRPSFERLEQPKMTKLGTAVSMYDNLLWMVRDSFHKAQEEALTAEELRRWLAKRGIRITPQGLKAALACSEVWTRRTRRPDGQHRCYHINDIYAACWHKDPNITMPSKLRAKLEAQQADEEAARRREREEIREWQRAKDEYDRDHDSQGRKIERDYQGRILPDDPKERLKYYQREAYDTKLGSDEFWFNRRWRETLTASYSDAEKAQAYAWRQARIADIDQKIAELEAKIAANQAPIQPEAAPQQV